MKLRFSALAIVVFCLAGCMNPQTRLQSEEEPEHEKEVPVQTIGDVTSVANAQPIPVSGVGLVEGLDGTGAPAPPSSFRTLLEDELKRRGDKDIKEALSSPNNAMVLISALIQPGVRKDEIIDVEVTLPPQSRVTSLRGGVLSKTVLYNYSSTHQISPNTNRPDRPLLGSKLGVAEGPVLVGFGDSDDEMRLRQGRIWGGGRVLIDRPFFLSLNPNQQFARTAMRVAERTNEVFQGHYHGSIQGLAEAKTKEVVYLGVAAQYRHNLARFLRVVRLIPLQETPPPGCTYRRNLERDLLDPAKTVVAALRLEALGPDSIPVLKKGLESTHALVRFTSAESLAYLGSPSCGEELANLTVEEPLVRAYCLTALASLDEAVCHVKLNELFANSSPETRYGAFRALRTLDEHDSNLRGEFVNNSYWLHQVAPDSPSMVHLSTSKRPEIVIFGDDARLEPPFSFLAGPEFTVTATEGDERCTLSRFSMRNGTQRRQCSLHMGDVLRAMGELGGTYPDVVELLRQAERQKCMSCALAVDALPEAPTVEQLAQAGRSGEGQRNAANPEILNARSEFGSTPNLFQRAGGSTPLRVPGE